MRIPCIGNWVVCGGVSYAPGKVIRVDRGKNSFTALFLFIYDKGEICNVKEMDFLLREIVTIINDKARIDVLNKELAGIVCEINI